MSDVSTVASRISSGALLGKLVARGIDAIPEEIAQARGLLQEFEELEAIRGAVLRVQNRFQKCSM